jgi:hypothetical protein
LMPNELAFQNLSLYYNEYQRLRVYLIRCTQ